MTIESGWVELAIFISATIGGWISVYYSQKFKIEDNTVRIKENDVRVSQLEQAHNKRFDDIQGMLATAIERLTNNISSLQVKVNETAEMMLRKELIDSQTYMPSSQVRTLVSDQRLEIREALTEIKATIKEMSIKLDTVSRQTQ